MQGDTRRYVSYIMENPHMTESQSQAAGLLELFRSTRDMTMQLVSTLARDDFIVQTAVFTSPPKWHMGHVSWIYEAVMSKIDAGYEFHSNDLTKYLNSYYQQFGVPAEKGLRGIVSRPTVDEIFEYYAMITRCVEELIISGRLDQRGRHLLTMGIHHECQHQELLVYDLQHLLADQYKPPKGEFPLQDQDTLLHHRRHQQTGNRVRALSVSGVECTRSDTPDATIAMTLIFQSTGHIWRIMPWTCSQSRTGSSSSLWQTGAMRRTATGCRDGWEKVKSNGWNAPMYWEEIDGAWTRRDFMGTRRINPNEPVCHVSYYEADAYCKWAGARLPTEAEWEKAACWNESIQEKTAFPWGNHAPTPERCNLLESYIWGTTEIGAYPAGASHAGCQQLIGDVWEWTSSEFTGYPGFKTGFDEYNDKWFTNQKVLRGGSFATPGISIRTSYRNFFRLDERWMFAGFRCARDAGT